MIATGQTAVGVTVQGASGIAAPELVEPMRDQHVGDGQLAQFRCKIYSAVEPTVEWFFNDRPIHSDGKLQMSARNGIYILNISNVYAADAGVYKCVVSNPAGEVTCIAHLRVGCE